MEELGSAVFFLERSNTFAPHCNLKFRRHTNVHHTGAQHVRVESWRPGLLDSASPSDQVTIRLGIESLNCSCFNGMADVSLLSVACRTCVEYMKGGSRCLLSTPICRYLL